MVWIFSPLAYHDQFLEMLGAHVAWAAKQDGGKMSKQHSNGVHLDGVNVMDGDPPTAPHSIILLAMCIVHSFVRPLTYLFIFPLYTLFIERARERVTRAVCADTKCLGEPGQFTRLATAIYNGMYDTAWQKNKSVSICMKKKIMG